MSVQGVINTIEITVPERNIPTIIVLSQYWSRNHHFRLQATGSYFLSMLSSGGVRRGKKIFV